ncbi:uncharacterized protein LOC141608038 [Silene latifolia]|uniref:uncharacterized protein LOC141608038 n=1 Tax=Silene latifolia TaxID=37657 RepID=UPI003D77EC2A
MTTHLRTFSTFSKTSGLNMSKGKSNDYFNGVPAGLKNEILQISGMVEGSLPFRYLGVPIKTTRLIAQDYKPIINKVEDIIKGLGARKLSFAGRLVLVKDVLKTPHNYRAIMFILPSGVIVRIEVICRNFLWDVGVDLIGSHLVSWEKACKPREKGGLDLKNNVEWNRAAVGKLVWWIATKPDHLWVIWVNDTYIKGMPWLTYESSTNSSGSNTEQIEHLFFNCLYSRKVIIRVGERLGISLPWHDLLTWGLGIMGSKTKKGIVNATINACIYHLWKQRNQSRHELTLLRPDKVALQIIEKMHSRVNLKVSRPVKDNDRIFLHWTTGY